MTYFVNKIDLKFIFTDKFIKFLREAYQMPDRHYYKLKALYGENPSFNYSIFIDIFVGFLNQHNLDDYKLFLHLNESLQCNGFNEEFVQQFQAILEKHCDAFYATAVKHTYFNHLPVNNLNLHSNFFN